jgi:hypothetical protein
MQSSPILKMKGKEKGKNKGRGEEMPKLSKRREASPSPRGQGEAGAFRTCTELSYWDFWR